ncbi:MAG: Diaminopimelate decarboxylase [Labilithrix sp.]|nr:Diaminopimelate decarboxylase [Labilithrix sp.]
MPVSRRDDGELTFAPPSPSAAVTLAAIARDPRFGTPTYVYDLDAISGEAREVEAAFGDAPHLVAYAVKANSAGPIVQGLAAAGCGADVVSGSELTLALRCGVPADKIVFSGVAKTDAELDLAIASGILSLQIESVEEIARIAARAAALGRVARVSLRINPAVEMDAIDTHRYITTGHDEAKFGVPLASLNDALEQLARAPGVELVGVGAHVGSQLTAVDGYLASARAVFAFARDVRARFALRFVGCGGGFGIDYGEGCSVRPADFVRGTLALQKESGLGDLALTCEPGRSMVGAHGVLLARVVQRKIAGERRWTMIDAGMNDLMRPALYQARHRIVPLSVAAGAALREYRVVGPVCESSDDFGVHELPDGPLEAVAILDSGAYGYSMASRYNGRALPAEVFLRGGAIALATPRQAPEAWVDDRLRASAL